MKWPKLTEESGTALIIMLALGAGMAASYGRELEADRKPDRHWWIRRLLIIPLLAIAATEATHLFGLTKSGAAFTAAMLSLGGYDALRWIEARWRRVARLPSQMPDEGEAPDGPSPR
jgi:hypothetical protein